MRHQTFQFVEMFFRPKVLTVRRKWCQENDLSYRSMSAPTCLHRQMTRHVRLHQIKRLLWLIAVFANIGNHSSRRMNPSQELITM